jgi:hypothetical protein
VLFLNSKNVLQSAAFTELCRSCLEEIVRADELDTTEGEVYAAVIAWAEAECKRQDLYLCGANVRQVLGDILHLIRFPLMDQSYFADFVTTKDILTQEEIIEVFRYMCGKNKQLERFSCQQRLQQRTEFVVERFGRNAPVTYHAISQFDNVRVVARRVVEGRPRVHHARRHGLRSRGLRAEFRPPRSDEDEDERDPGAPTREDAPHDLPQTSKNPEGL